MEAVSIRIQSLEDAAKGIPLADGLKEVPSECHRFSVGILEGGTQAGQTSLMFICQDDKGGAVIGQMTGKQFEMLYQAFKGAKERFGA